LVLKFLDRSSITEKPSPFVKFLMRCLTSCMRVENGQMAALQSAEFLEKMIEILRVIGDEEILANTSKIIRLCLTDDQNLDQLVKKRKDIGNILIETLNMHAYSEAIS
jgi:hypothetical protein